MLRTNAQVFLLSIQGLREDLQFICPKNAEIHLLPELLYANIAKPSFYSGLTLFNSLQDARITSWVFIL
jgi:hypothetical protein